MVELEQMASALDEAERLLHRARHEVLRETELIRYWGDGEVGRQKRRYVDELVAQTAVRVREILHDVGAPS